MRGREYRTSFMIDYQKGKKQIAKVCIRETCALSKTQKVLAFIPLSSLTPSLPFSVPSFLSSSFFLSFLLCSPPHLLPLKNTKGGKDPGLQSNLIHISIFPGQHSPPWILVDSGPHPVSPAIQATRVPVAGTG